MDADALIPITLFICLTLSIKFGMEAYTKRRLLESRASDELVRAMLAAEERSRQLSAYIWGTVMTSVGLAFGVIHWLGLDSNSAGALGLLVGAAGVGLVVSRFLAPR